MGIMRASVHQGHASRTYRFVMVGMMGEAGAQWVFTEPFGRTGGCWWVFPDKDGRNCGAAQLPGVDRYKL